MLLLLSAWPLGAQSRSPQVTLRLGIADTPDSFASSCGDVIRALGVEMRSGGRTFPFASLDHSSRLGGGDVLCGVPVSNGLVRSGGGLSLDGTTSVMAGMGWRSQPASAQFEALLGAGALRGPQGYGDRAETVVRPAVGFAAGVVLFRHLVLSADARLVRLSYHGAGEAIESASWKSLRTWRIGARF